MSKTPHNSQFFHYYSSYSEKICSCYIFLALPPFLEYDLLCEKAMYNPLPLALMNKQPNHYLIKSRKAHHLNLNDLAYILEIDQGNLSRFEAGKLSNPKALLGYHIFFNLSIQSSFGQVIDGGVKNFVNRCFQLMEQIESAPNTLKNRLRLEGLNTVITRLMELENDHD